MSYRSVSSHVPCVLQIALSMLLVSYAGAASAQPDQAAREADRLLAEALENDRGPGAMAAVMIDGEIVWSRALGRADLEADVALTERTRMRLGSVSKPLAAALVVRLVELGRLDLDEPISTYLPDLPDWGRSVTSRQLAAHTSGIRHYDFTNFAEANNMRPLSDLEEALARLDEDAIVAPPGSRVEYSSWGYNLLGAVAQRAAGKPYLEAFADLVAAPLELDDTVGDRSLDLVERRSRFYTVKEDGTVINTIWRDSSDCYPSCGMLSTARDLVHFANQVFAETTPWPRNQELFTSPVPLDDGSTSGRTVGWKVELDESDTVLWYGHGGETNGGIALIRYFPEQRMAVAGAANYNFWFAGEPEFFEAVGTKIPALFADGVGVVDVVPE